MQQVKLASGVILGSDDPAMIEQYVKYGASLVMAEEHKPVKPQRKSTKKSATKVASASEAE